MKSSYTLVLAFLISSCSTAQIQSIDESKFVSIGGIEQWISIKGDDTSKPILLFIHGGPGSTMSQFENAMYTGWEKDFVLVNWDQRGAGKTYGRNAPSEVNEDYWMENSLTVKEMTADGIEVTEYILKQLKKDKVILVGTSWGSILGTEMALSKPQLFHAYLGHSQFVSFRDNFDYSYAKTYELAKKENNIEAIEKLESLGKPPYNNARSYGQLLRVVKSYEQNNSTEAPDTWFKLALAYDNEEDSKARYDGDDYSFIHFVGHEKLQIKSMAADIDFNQNGLTFEMPVYYIQGEQDILTAAAINKPYFDKIEAPKKAYFLLPDAGHGHNKSVVDKQFEIVNQLEIVQ
ncbi:alpha/beta hydrolase [uncultured Arcticibacterium sp.]|uniref:alpha/beta hydrolase n=1 Tax=uncultured Arcticibacterium sp. TaxID=2173042 RepID=UPI0030F79F9F